jgi:hypothetical protein
MKKDFTLVLWAIMHLQDFLSILRFQIDENEETHCSPGIDRRESSHIGSLELLLILHQILHCCHEENCGTLLSKVDILWLGN